MKARERVKVPAKAEARPGAAESCEKRRRPKPTLSLSNSKVRLEQRHPPRDIPGRLKHESGKKSAHGKLQKKGLSGRALQQQRRRPKEVRQG